MTLETAGSVRITPLPGGRTKIEILPVDSEPRYLSKKEVAARFGVTPRTIENWTKARKNPLPVTKTSGRPRFIESELSSWLSKGRPKGVTF